MLTKIKGVKLIWFSPSLYIIGDASNLVLMSASKCTCYGSQSTRNTQSLAIGVCVIFGLIILTLLVFIVAIAHKNGMMFSNELC